MQISELSSRELSDLIYELLADIRDDGKNKTDVVLQTPTASSKFPCRVIQVPLDQVTKTENATPIVKRFQITIECWAKGQRECMDMGDRTDKVLRDKNLIRTITTPVLLDEVAKKYRLITSYEVDYYGINNSFEVIR